MLTAVLLLFAQSSPAEKLFHDIQAKVAAANTLSGVSKASILDDGITQSAELYFFAKKPNLYRVKVVSNSRTQREDIYDGKTLYSSLGRMYGSSPGDSKMFGYQVGPGFDAFFTPVHPELKVVGPVVHTTYKGRDAKAIEVDLAAGKDTLYIDPATEMPLGYEQRYSNSPIVMNVDYSDLQLNSALDPDLFVFHPTPNMREFKGSMEENLVRVDRPAPTFVASTANGESVSLGSALKGHKALLLNFWFYG